MEPIKRQIINLSYSLIKKDELKEILKDKRAYGTPKYMKEHIEDGIIMLQWFFLLSLERLKKTKKNLTIRTSSSLSEMFCCIPNELVEYIISYFYPSTEYFMRMLFKQNNCGYNNGHIVFADYYKHSYVQNEYDRFMLSHILVLYLNHYNEFDTKEKSLLAQSFHETAKLCIWFMKNWDCSIPHQASWHNHIKKYSHSDKNNLISRFQNCPNITGFQSVLANRREFDIHELFGELYRSSNISADMPLVYDMLDTYILEYKS